MLLPVIALVRRVDLAEVIGAALVRRAAGAGHRTIGGELGVPPTTAREWLRRFAARAAEIRAHFTRLAAWLDPSGGAITPRGQSPRGRRRGDRPRRPSRRAALRAGVGVAVRFGRHRGEAAQQHELALPGLLGTDQASR